MEIAAKIIFARLEAPEAHADQANIPDLRPSTQPVWQRPSGQSGEQQLSAQKSVIPAKVGMTDIV
jgi:Tfp pilus assembly protein FimT